MLEAMDAEIALHAHPSNAAMAGMILPDDEIIETLYFGGGTPSILSAGEIARLIERVQSVYNLSPNTEITLEGNPDDIGKEKSREWKTAGINRLSIGIQSFAEKDLKWMNRVHNSEQAAASITLARDAGFENFSIDLIFGLPDLTDDEWHQNIEKVIQFRVPHVACYALTVEPRSALDKMIRLGKKRDIDQDAQARQFKILMDRLQQAGYEHYEISNFALPGYRSRHNSSYWQQKKYLGIGPSAHSFDGDKRYWNIANNPLYLKALAQRQPFFEMETLTPQQKLNEYIMTSVRTVEGLDLTYIEAHFGKSRRFNVEEKIRSLDNQWFSLEKEHLVLTPEGQLFADRISVILFE